MRRACRRGAARVGRQPGGPPAPRALPAWTPALERRAASLRPWKGGLEPVGGERGDGAVGPYRVPLDGLGDGQLPRGTLYVAGPGRLRLGSSPGAARHGHWFDGCGRVTALTLEEGGLRVVSKLVDTARVVAQKVRRDEDAESGFARRGAWTPAQGAAGNALPPTSPANTSVLLHGGRVFALCEGGAPVEVDPVTLDTRGEAACFDTRSLGFAAHYKRDPRDGVVYNFGLKLDGGFSVFAIAPDGGGVVRRGEFRLGPVGELTFVHDFAMSENFLVFLAAPWVCARERAVPALLGLQTLGHSFAWAEGRGASLVVVRKHDLSVAHQREVSEAELGRFSAYHFANAYEDDAGELHVLAARLIGRREALEANFSDMYRAEWREELYNHLWDIRLDARPGEGFALLGAAPALPTEGAGAQLPLDFPSVAPGRVGGRARYVYAAAFAGSGARYFDAVQKLDLESGTSSVAPCAPGTFPSEPQFVPRPGASREDDGWVLHLLYRAATHTSALVVRDARDLAAQPVAEVELPHHVPYVFHGAWAADP